MNANKLLMSVQGFKEFSSDVQAMSSDHNSSELGLHNHSNEQSSLKLVPNVVSPADKTATSRQVLELLFHHHITMLRSTYAHVPSQQELDVLFGPLYDEIFNVGSNPQDKQPTTNIQPTSVPPTPTSVHADENNDGQAEEDHLPDDEFTNPFLERETGVTKDTMPPTNNESTKDVQPQVVQIETLISNFKLVVGPVVEPVEATVSALNLNQKLSIPYPSRLHDQKLRNKTNDQKEKFFKIFQDLDFNISFADALILMPKFGPTIKKKLGDPGKFLIPCDFLGMDECLAWANLGTSINLMPLSVWNKLSLPDLSHTCMTLKLADRSISCPVETGRALIDVYKRELTLHVGKEAVTFNLDQPSRYFANYDAMSVNRIDLINVACEEYSQEVL
nr:reverse transcriptase domain-containing protein [Tanacetum cinerariifolium]